MDVQLRRGRAVCAALLFAGVLASGAVSAQGPIEGGPVDVATVVTIPPQEEAPSATAPRSSYDYEAARASGAPDKPGNRPPGAVAAATVAAPPPGFSAFTGAALPLSCRQAGYRMIIDEHSDLRSGTLCTLPDGSWQFLP